MPYKDPEKISERNKLYHQNNLEKISERKKLYYQNNPEKLRERSKLYRQNNPEKIALLNSRRRARKAKVEKNDLTAAQWREIKLASNHKCVYCGKKFKNLTMDHITPISKGGNHTVSNVVPACRSCNSKKQAGPPLAPVQPLLLTFAPPAKRSASGSST